MNDDYSDLIEEAAIRSGATLTKEQVDTISDAIYHHLRNGYLSRSTPDAPRESIAPPLPNRAEAELRLAEEALRVAYGQRDPVRLAPNGDVVRVTDGGRLDPSMLRSRQ